MGITKFEQNFYDRNIKGRGRFYVRRRNIDRMVCQPNSTRHFIQKQKTNRKS